MALKAQKCEPTYNGSYELLIAVGWEYLLINDPQAETILDETIQLNPQYAKSWFANGLVLASRGKYDQAILAYDRALEINPQYTAAYNNKGNALYGQGKYDEAIKAYDEALRQDPKYAMAWNNKGNALYGQGKYG